MARPKVSFARRRMTRQVESNTTPAQKRWNRIFVSTGDPKLANYKVYGDEAINTPSSPENLLRTKPFMREVVMRVMEDRGITIPFLVEKHKKVLLKAKKNSDLLKGVELGYKLYGAFDDPEEKSKKLDISVGIDLFIKQREERGLEIPAEVIEAKKQLEERNVSLAQKKKDGTK